MKKYIWKCESNDCGKEFVAENPNSCPECGGDDIFIIKERGSPLKKILIAIVAIIVVGLVWCNWCNIFPKEDGPKMENGYMTYNLKIEESKNYFEITGSDEKLGLFVEDENGDRLYHKKNKFYPCKSGDFYVKWEEDSKIKVKGKTEFNFELETPHKNACDEQLEIYDAAANPSTCTYTIRTNMDDNAQLEVGLKKGGKYRKGKLVWTKEEAGSASYFYVRIKGGERLP